MKDLLRLFLLGYIKSIKRLESHGEIQVGVDKIKKFRLLMSDWTIGGIEKGVRSISRRYSD